MKLAGILGTALLALILAAPLYAQEQHDQDEQKDQKEQTAKPAQDEKKAQSEKSAKQDEKGAQPDKNARPEEKNAQQEKNSKPEEKNAQQQHAQPAKNAGGRIPADRYKANFGREHTFRVSQGDFNNHRFQYGGYWFGFAAPWPSNWLYTQQVFVVDIGGVYYLCNPTYPGVNVELNITL